jgi:hypothetical protein
MTRAEAYDAQDIPPYESLPVFARTGEHHAWDVFGLDDQLGTMNFVTKEAVVAAAGEVATGETICLSLPMDQPAPSLVPRRTPFEHSVTRSRMGRDDSLSNFFLQCSSQWDGLQHIRYREFGYYGGRQEHDLDNGILGIDVLAKHGIVGRGVLIDVERYMAAKGMPLAQDSRVLIAPDLLDKTLESQGTKLRRGDILLLRTGWLGWYLGLSAAMRQALGGRQHGGEDGLETPGLDPRIETAAWLWNHGAAAAAADNPALEALRIRREDGFLHHRILALLGMPIGEFFLLDGLASACSAAGRWSFMLVSAPFNLPNGVGSPNNAYAIL